MKTKLDVGKLDEVTQAHLRKAVVGVVRDGIKQIATAKIYKVSVRVMSEWMKTAREGGLRAPPRQNSCRPDRIWKSGGAIRTRSGEVRTSIQGQGGCKVAAAG
ncbi:hypothetical protein, partial [Burkholderia sp. HI2714]|uniref:hypothetical protein n=1 Tax=Burkholderia sp. HI2714 TaxID=2015359 RepID=UPI001C5295FD